MAGPIHHSAMRASNLALVLRAVAESRRAPRSRITDRTGLTKSSVAGLVADLTASGLVHETLGPPTRGRGRPSAVVALDPSGAAGLGLEVNVDYLAALVTDLAGTVRYRHVVSRDNRERTPAEVLTDLADLGAAATTATEEQGLALAGTCVAVPGTVADGRVLRAPNLGWTDLAVDVRLPPTPWGPVVENEANLAALAELWYGEVPDDFVHVSGEIGIGGGIVVGGELFRGSHGRAGELGHMVLDPEGPACSCGGRGCLERLAGQDAILEAAGAHDRADLEARCVGGDVRALSAVEQAGRYLGTALASVANLIDPDTVVLGGVFASLAPWLRDTVAETLARHGARPEVRVSQLGTEAAVRGAARSVVRRVVTDPAGFLAVRDAVA
jgi:predicted NBD/HSP70 family sugar kinase